MKNLIHLALLSAALLLPACSSDDPPAPDQEPSQAVVVAENGTRFDPPETKEKMPDGAWICDMGTVHFASMSVGDGTCPICGMSLKEHSAESQDSNSSD